MTIDWSLYPNFEPEEFTCSCGCGRADMNAAFMKRLQKMRDVVGPMRITSGFRCENHPAEKRKLKGPGAHSIGHAADVRFSSGTQLFKIIDIAGVWGFLGIGVDKNFIHLDDKHPFATRPAAWGY